MSTISHSQLSKWRNCQKAWQFRYIHKLKPRTTTRALAFGSLVHGCLKRHYTGKDALAWLHRSAEANNWLDDHDRHMLYLNVEANLVEYIRHWHGQELIKPLLVEKYFEVPLTLTQTLRGYWDMIAEDASGKKWLVEHKTGRQEISADLRYFDLQSTMYQWAWNKLHPDDPLHGTIWNYFTSTPLMPPRILKGGTPTRAKSQATTWSLYYNSLLELGLKPDEYDDIREYLEEKINEYFHRIYLPVDLNVQTALMDDAVATLNQVERARRRKRYMYVRNPGRHCGWCDFASLCQVEMVTGEWQHAVEPDYEIEDTQEQKHR